MAGQPTTPSLAKVSPPRLPPVLERSRLFRELDRARKIKPVIWISAPPGAGKTTLAASYMRARKLRCLWYQMDEGDAEAATFFHYLGLAAKRAAPRYRTPLPHLTPEYLGGLPTFTRRFFETLYSRLDPRMVLVFDNYQTVPLSSSLHDLFEIGLRVLPKGLTALVLSREPFPPSVARLQADQALALLDTDALRLTERETSGIMRLPRTAGRQAVTRTVPKELVAKLRGWVAGLVLVLEQGKGAMEPAAPLSMEASQRLFTYFAREVLQGLRTEMQGFLLKTAFLSSMTVGMAERLTGMSEAATVLASLYRSRYFTERRQEPEPVYQYHPLFREFLLAQARNTFQPDHLAAIQRTVAGLLEESGRIEEAMAVHQEAGEVVAQVRLILTQAPTFLAQGRLETLERWIRHLPCDVLAQNPWLRFWLGTCVFPYNPGAARDAFESAFAQFTDQEEQTGALLACCGAVESVLFTWNDFRLLDPWIERLNAVVPPDITTLPPELAARVASALITANLWRRPNGPSVPHWLGIGLDLLPHAREPVPRAFLAFHLMSPLTWFGDTRGAERLYRMLAPDLDRQTSPPLAQLLFALTESFAAWWLGRTEDALRAVARGMEIAQNSGIRIVEDPLEATRVWALLFAGDLEGVRRSLSGQQALLEELEEFKGGIWNYQTALFARRCGNPEKAWHHLTRSFRLISGMGTPFWEALWTIARVDVALALGRQVEADHLLGEGRIRARGIPSKLLEFQFDLLEADLALDRGQQTAALAALGRGFAVAREQELPDTPWWIPPVMARLCAAALEQGIEVDYVQQLIRKRRLAPDVPALAPDTWPWSIKLRTFGGFEIRLDGQPVQFGRKLPHRPLLLLKALIAHGGRAVPIGTLADDLWPDAEGDAAAAAMTTTLARLRKLLGADDAVTLQEGRLSLNAQTCWLDIWTFEHLFEAAEAAKEKGSPKVWARLAERAFHCYRGPFLSGDLDEPWTHRSRDRLRRKYARLAAELSAHWLKIGQAELAEKCRESVVAVDPDLR